MTQELATFAAGCFWGVEKYFLKHFQQSIVWSKVGYTGGSKSDPSYKEVCSGATGHAEALQIMYDTSNTSYKELVTLFFRIHDPTTLNEQGNDKGTQYRSAIFYHSPQQKEIAESVIPEVQKHFENKIVTSIVPATTFYSAEEYHQKYLAKNPSGYCNHFYRW
ncbi:peptide methionine sulfoxide reductase [Rozella allomycis CSF55]|uniref:peptide-methionine (S)-S-oxide reductase n=1 Tax=Rozella allomycis (strain CSF55) TaxID=988480 RepID=A0A075AYD2_ROZAC|nr:Peptide methionine sulfoxide reductase MsrA domain-containing protein [Rozella allomycis CSF55]RKP21663.1 peptide methionine sulfoxide reductase [Rozella allomycis CSF55]|eukprot:EPZ35099.1 Peptide methionine sulfoxide reductase MsrA domain-containing protein [Rozella allomycis CSF55]